MIVVDQVLFSPTRDSHRFEWCQLNNSSNWQGGLFCVLPSTDPVALLWMLGFVVVSGVAFQLIDISA